MPRDPRTRRYPLRLIAFVGKLGEQGYRTSQALALLGKMGVDPLPARETVKRWLDPDFAEADRMRQRKGLLPGPQPQRKWTWQRKLQRLHQLSGLGISYEAVARVMNHDYGLTLTCDQVRRIENGTTSSDDSLRALMEGRRLRRGRGPAQVASKQDGRANGSEARSPLQAGTPPQSSAPLHGGDVGRGSGREPRRIEGARVHPDPGRRSKAPAPGS